MSGTRIGETDDAQKTRALTTKEAAEFLGCSPSPHLAHARCHGVSKHSKPVSDHVDYGGLIRYPLSWLEKFQEEHRVKS